MDKNDFSTLMDQVIVRENLPGNCASDPKKSVRIMVCADFEDSSVPQEKVISFLNPQRNNRFVGACTKLAHKTSCFLDDTIKLLYGTKKTR